MRDISSRRRKTGRASGFTLVEVLVAMVILGVGILAIVQLFPQSLRQTRVNAERTDIGQLASSKLDRLRMEGVGGMSQWIVDNAMRNLDATARAYTLYEGWQSTVQRTAIGPDTYRVTFTVKLTDGRTETFVTYVTKQ